MSREKFITPGTCVGCPQLKAWDRRLDSINRDIENAPESTAEVFGTSDIELYMTKVDTEEGHYLHQYMVAKTVIDHLIEHCDGFTTRKDVVNVGCTGEQVDPLVVDIPVCGIPNEEWEGLNRVLLYLPLEGEDE